MIAWLQANIGTILISVVLLGIIVAIVRNMVKKMKSGSSPCGCSSGECSACGKSCSACSQPIKIKAPKDGL